MIRNIISSSCAFPATTRQNICCNDLFRLMQGRVQGRVQGGASGGLTSGDQASVPLASLVSCNEDFLHLSLYTEINGHLLQTLILGVKLLIC